jgi:hypothetical protein
MDITNLTNPAKPPALFTSAGGPISFRCFQSIFENSVPLLDLFSQPGQPAFLRLQRILAHLFETVYCICQLGFWSNSSLSRCRTPHFFRIANAKRGESLESPSAFLQSHAEPAAFHIKDRFKFSTGRNRPYIVRNHVHVMCKNQSAWANERAQFV